MTEADPHGAPDLSGRVLALEAAERARLESEQLHQEDLRADRLRLTSLEEKQKLMGRQLTKFIAETHTDRDHMRTMMRTIMATSTRIANWLIIGYAKDTKVHLFMEETRATLLAQANADALDRPERDADRTILRGLADWRKAAEVQGQQEAAKRAADAERIWGLVRSLQPLIVAVVAGVAILVASQLIGNRAYTGWILAAVVVLCAIYFAIEYKDGRHPKPTKPTKP